MQKANTPPKQEQIVGNGSGTLPMIQQKDADICNWAQTHRQWIETTLSKHGALLFRGFDVTSDTLKDFGPVVSQEWMTYVDRATKRSTVDGPVQTATDTPAQFEIPLHCESSFTSRWPSRLFFNCLQPSHTGGRTPIADVRRVHDTIEPTLRQKFAELGVMYVRNFTGGPGMDWREVFQVETKEELEAYCREAHIATEWISETHLRTRQVRPAIIKHPQTGELVWFNHSLALHVSSLESNMRETMLRQYGEAGLPHNVYFGNGEVISNEEMAIIRECHQNETLGFDWQPGDLLLVDNMLVAHSREAFEGSRKVVVAMADPFTWDGLGISLSSFQQDGEVPFPKISESSGTAERSATPKAERPADITAAVTAIMCEVLEVDTMDPEDDFLDLGGDSMSAARVITRILETLGVELEMDTFFEEGTPSALAAFIEEQAS